jgi:hypothetical protein
MVKKLISFVAAGALVLMFGSALGAQQVGDAEFKFENEEPTYEPGQGPLVLVDEAHSNFHTISGRFQTFAQVGVGDGYRVEPSAAPITKELLEHCRVFVISNARSNGTSPSAFADDEIGALKEWVESGGSLLLIADHMPFSGYAIQLAKAFDIQFTNGFAFELGDAPNGEWSTTGAQPTVFARDTGTLGNHPITNGVDPSDRIDSMRTFTGQAFQAEAPIQPLMVFSPEFVSLMPQVAWEFSDDTPRVSVDGWYQGAALEYGRGRAAFFGEAAMFTAQVSGPNRVPMGMNSPMAEQNPQFVLNVLGWLSGVLN